MYVQWFINVPLFLQNLKNEDTIKDLKLNMKALQTKVNQLQEAVTKSHEQCKNFQAELTDSKKQIQELKNQSSSKIAAFVLLNYNFITSLTSWACFS